jgi:ABC-type amino acid transport substrate-binding protein
VVTRHGRALLLLLPALVLVWGTGLADVRVGVFGRDPPFSFVDENGELAGFDIDIARALCAEARFECELVPTDWSELLPALQSRELDVVVASVAITDDRRERVLFTRPYYRTPVRFVARAGAFDTVTPEFLAGERIGVWRGTTMDAYLSANYAGQADIIRYSTQSGALVDLVLGRVDLVLGETLSLERNFLAADHGAGFAFAGPPIDDPEWFGHGNGVAVARHNRGLRELFDRAIANIHVNGVFDRIQRHWFGDEEAGDVGGGR